MTNTFTLYESRAGFEHECALCGHIIWTGERSWFCGKNKRYRRYYCSPCTGFLSSRYSLIQLVGTFSTEESLAREYYEALAYQWSKGDIESPNEPAFQVL